MSSHMLTCTCELLLVPCTCNVALVSLLPRICELTLVTCTYTGTSADITHIFCTKTLPFLAGLPELRRGKAESPLQVYDSVEEVAGL